MDESRTGISILGLTHDPFREPEEAFFEGGDRTRQLEELRHLSRWSRRLLVVTGEQGLGKSTLFRTLSSRLDPGVKAARVKGTLLNSTRDVLVAIVQGFGLACAANANTQVLRRLICDDVETQSAADRYCLVLIDDAHLLEARAVEQLLQLVRTQPLRIVFFAETQFVQILEREASHGDSPLSWHEIRLAPFGTEEVRRYLKLRLREAGGKGNLPFTSKQVAEIIAQSKGLPGRISELASERLKVQAQAMVQQPSSKLLEIHRSIAYLVIVLTALSWLVWDRVQDPEVLPATAALTPEDVVLPEQQLEPAVVTVAAVVAVEPEPVETSQDAESTDQPESGPVTAPEPEPVLLSEPTPEPDAEIVTPEKVVPETTTSSVFRGSVEWILQQPPSNYTLQLFGTSNKEKWQQFVRKQQGNPEIISFQTTRNSQPWYVVLYGSYVNQAAATVASTELPASVGKLNPWIRTFSGIQNGLKNTD